MTAETLSGLDSVVTVVKDAVEFPVDLLVSVSSLDTKRVKPFWDL